VQESAAANDVTVSKCSVTKDFGVALTHATVRITNSTDRTQSYLATISVNDSSGARVGEVNVVSNSLARRSVRGARLAGFRGEGLQAGAVDVHGREGGPLS
jgi:hypothetical protein